MNSEILKSKWNAISCLLEVFDQSFEFVRRFFEFLRCRPGPLDHFAVLHDQSCNLIELPDHIVHRHRLRPRRACDFLHQVIELALPAQYSRGLFSSHFGSVSLPATDRLILEGCEHIGSRRSAQNRHTLDLRVQRQPRRQPERVGRAGGDARQQRAATDVERHHHLARTFD